jgi:hemerythrin-like domain-containing protein
MHADTVRQMADFLKNFVDRCHHAKEEKHLFAQMHAHGMAMTSGPLAVMLREHEQGRAHVRAITEAMGNTGSPSAPYMRKVRDELSAYAALLRGHIDKEDNVLYPMADRLFTAEEQNALTQAFERVEAEEMGAGVHERYHAWIETLVQE